MIYLDNAATSFPKPESVYRAVELTQRSIGANPGRSGHRLSLSAARILLDTREALAALLHISDPESLIFGSNCTDMLNLAIHGVCREGMNVLTSVYAHNSVLRPLNHLARTGKIHLQTVTDIPSAIRRNTDLVVVPHANNVTGVIQPIEQIAVLCQMNRARLIVDAAQTAGVLPLYPEEWGVDLCAMPGHKGLLGPQGTGVLYIRPGLNLTPIKQGGTGTSSQLLFQPDELPERYESGTMNTPGIAGLGQGTRFCLHHRAEIRGQELLLTELLIGGLLDIPHVQVYGALDAISRVGTLSFNLGQHPSGEIADALDQSGLCVRAGLHCAPLIHETLGTMQQGAVRVSLGFSNTESDVKALLHTLDRLAKGAVV